MGPDESRPSRRRSSDQGGGSVNHRRKYVYRFITREDVSSNVIGRQVFVLWPDDGTWYRGVIKRCNVSTGVATIYYRDTQETEQVELKDLIKKKEIAFKEARPSDYECESNEVEVPVTENVKENDDEVYTSSDDSILDAGAQDIESDMSDFSFESGRARRRKLAYSDDDDDEQELNAGIDQRKRDLKRKKTTQGGISSQKKVRTPGKSTPATGGRVVVDDAEVRLKVRNMLSQALQLAAQELTEKGTSVDSSSAASIAGEIERTLVQLYGPVTKEYKSKVRSLQFNLRDVHNPDLRAHVLLGDITPMRLAQMTATELASKELAEYRKQKEQEALKMSVLDAEAAAKFSTAAALDARDNFSQPAALATERMLATRGAHSPGGSDAPVGGDPSPLPASSSKKRSAKDGQPLGEASDSGGDGEMMEATGANSGPIVWADLKAQALTATQTSLKEQTSFDVPALEALQPVLPLVSPDSIAATEEGKEARSEAPNNPKHEASAFEDLFLPSPPTALHAAPWQSLIVVPGSGAFPMAGESLVGLHSLSSIAGAADLMIRGRVAMPKLRSFLKELRASRHRTASLGVLHLAANASPEQKVELEKLINQYISKQRCGVSEPAPGAEVYLLPPSELTSDLLRGANTTAIQETGRELKSDELLAVAVYRRNWQPPQSVAPTLPPVPTYSAAPTLPPGAAPQPVSDIPVSLPAGLDLNAISSLAQLMGVAPVDQSAQPF